MSVLAKGYERGTHRLVAPEETLAAVAPLLGEAGVTRCADVTGLDRLGIPVACAIRPRGRVLQVTNGKGLRQVDARASAVMEAIELFHAEHPPDDLPRASLERMLAARHAVVTPDQLPNARWDIYRSPAQVVAWVEGEDLHARRPVWLPASAVYATEPMLYHGSTNGLASGNHPVEATLHGLYEVIERDAVSRLSTNGAVDLAGRTTALAPASFPDGPVRDLAERIEAADVRLVLLAVAAPLPFPVFMAVLVDETPFSHASSVNVGYGCHRSPGVAACRAITEAAQSRLTYIHGSREDLEAAAYTQSHDRLRAFFAAMPEGGAWAFDEPAASTLDDDLALVLGALDAAGFPAYRVTLTRPPFNVPVVRVFVPGLRLNQRLF